MAMMPSRFTRLVVANTALPTGDQPMGQPFEDWRSYWQSVEMFSAGRIVSSGTVSKLTDEEFAAYDAPFPDASFQMGAREFPLLVPDRPDDPSAAANRAAWEVLRGLDLPVLTVFGGEDNIMAGVDRVFQTQMPGAAGQPDTVLPGVGHFIQEDPGPELALLTNAFIDRT